MKYITTVEENEFYIEILNERQIVVDGVTYAVDFESISEQPIYSLVLNGKSYEAHVYQGEDGWQILLLGSLYKATVEDEREKRLRLAMAGTVQERGDYYLKAPMPGLVISVPVVDGQMVNKGDVLVILESMKMQNELRSPRQGRVSRVRVKAGDSVEQKQTLLSVA